MAKEIQSNADCSKLENPPNLHVNQLKPSIYCLFFYFVVFLVQPTYKLQL